MKHGRSNSGIRGLDEEEKEWDRYPAHVRSPPTFQPWLRLCVSSCWFARYTLPVFADGEHWCSVYGA